MSNHEQPASSDTAKPPSRERVQFQSESLGSLGVGFINVGALIEVEGLLNGDKKPTDEDLARIICSHVVTKHGETDAEQGPLSLGELKAMSLTDLERCAEILLKDPENWVGGVDPQTLTGTTLSRLAVAIEKQIEQFSKQTSRFMKSLSPAFSPATRNLLKQSLWLGDSLFKRMPALDAITAFPKSPLLDFASRYKSPLSSESIKITATEPLPAIDWAELHRNSPESRAAKSLKALEDKADQSMAVAVRVAEMLAATNAAVISGLNDFAKERDRTSRSDRRNVVIAITALVVSALLSLFAFGQDFLNNRSGGRYQERVQTLLELQQAAQDRNALAVAKLASGLEKDTELLQAEVQKHPAKPESVGKQSSKTHR